MLQFFVLSKNEANNKRLDSFFSQWLGHCKTGFYEKPDDLLASVTEGGDQIVIADRKSYSFSCLKGLDKKLSEFNVTSVLMMPNHGKINSSYIFSRYSSLSLIIEQEFDPKTLLSFLKLLNTSRCYVSDTLSPLNALDLININTNVAKCRYNMFEVINNTSEGAWFWDIKRNKMYLSDVFRENLGYDKEQLCDDMEMFVSLIHPEDKKVFRQSVSEYLNRKTDRFNLEVRLRCMSSSYKWFLLRGYAAWNKLGNPVNLMTIQMDVDEIKKKMEQLENLALYDRLTGLPNRNLLYDRIHTAMVNSSRNHLMAGLLFIDIDDFKSINDKYGHKFGDLVLKKTAKRLKSCVRKIDTVSRIYGDEFIIVLPLLSGPEGIEKFTIRIRKLFEKRMRIQKMTIAVSCSIGTSIYPRDGNTIDDLLETADASMYKRKNMYKNLYPVRNE